jgi:hypothetical protein
MDVDVAPFGAIAIDVRRADGSAVSRLLGFFVAPASSEGSGLLEGFWNAPYVVLGLKPRSWRVTLATPDSHIPPQFIDVKAGELATLKFVLP